MISQIDTSTLIKFNIPEDMIGMWYFMIHGQPSCFSRDPEEATYLFGQVYYN